ncbi:MAG: YtxH domain-containing protein [Alistipes sp.]|nr:YtxH domain-containing protein [Alistipes sp.]
MKHTCYCFASLLGGMIVGAAAAMLLTPKSGPEMRAALKSLVDEELDKVRCRCKEDFDKE